MSKKKGPRPSPSPLIESRRLGKKPSLWSGGMGMPFRKSPWSAYCDQEKARNK